MTNSLQAIAIVASFRSFARKASHDDVRRSSRWSERFLCDLVEAYDARTPEDLAAAVLAHCDHERAR